MKTLANQWNLKTLEMLLVPINIAKTHWILVAVDFYTKSIQIYDTLGTSRLGIGKV